MWTPPSLHRMCFYVSVAFVALDNAAKPPCVKLEYFQDYNRSIEFKEGESNDSFLSYQLAASIKSL